MHQFFGLLTPLTCCLDDNREKDVCILYANTDHYANGFVKQMRSGASMQDYVGELQLIRLSVEDRQTRRSRNSSRTNTERPPQSRGGVNYRRQLTVRFDFVTNRHGCCCCCCCWLRRESIKIAGQHRSTTGRPSYTPSSFIDVVVWSTSWPPISAISCSAPYWTRYLSFTLTAAFVALPIKSLQFDLIAARTWIAECFTELGQGQGRGTSLRWYR